MEQRENLLGVIQTLYKWRKSIIYLCGIVGIGTMVISLLFLDNFYQSTTVFLAASPDLSTPEPVGAALVEKRYYGQEEDIDRMLTTAKSDKVADYLIQKYNLYEHYEVDSTKALAAFDVKKKFNGLYSVIKTKYDAIELSIEDKDPVLAKSMVNDARDKINILGQAFIKQSQTIQIEDFKKSIMAKEGQLFAMSDSLIKLRQEFGVFNTETQGDLFAKMVAEAESKLVMNSSRLSQMQSSGSAHPDTIRILKANVGGMKEQVKSLEARLARFNKGMPSVDVLEQMHLETREALALDQERLRKITAAYQSNSPSVLVVEEGTVPVKKSRPKRSILILTATFLTFIFSVIGVLLIDTYRDINWKETLNA